MAKLTKLTKKIFLEIYENNKGSVTNACEVIGICRNIYYKELKKDVEFQQTIKNIDEKFDEELIILSKAGLRVNLKRNKQSAIEYKGLAEEIIK